MGADVEQDDADNQDAEVHAEGGTWVALRDAAAILGVSVDTVKRRMQKGELERRRETIPQGFRWLVRVDPVVPEAVGSPVTNETPPQGLAVPSQSPDVVAALLHELEVRNQEIARLHAIVAALTHAVEQRPILPPTVEEPKEASSETPESLESVPDEPPIETYRATTQTSAEGILERLRRWIAGNR